MPDEQAARLLGDGDARGGIDVHPSARRQDDRATHVEHEAAVARDPGIAGVGGQSQLLPLLRRQHPRGELGGGDRDGRVVHAHAAAGRREPDVVGGDVDTALHRLARRGRVERASPQLQGKLGLGDGAILPEPFHLPWRRLVDVSGVECLELRQVLPVGPDRLREEGCELQLQVGHIPADLFVGGFANVERLGCPEPPKGELVTIGGHAPIKTVLARDIPLE